MSYTRTSQQVTTWSHPLSGDTMPYEGFGEMFEEAAVWAEDCARPTTITVAVEEIDRCEHLVIRLVMEKDA